MRHNYFLLALIFSMFFATKASSQSLYLDIVKWEGASKSASLDEVRKITFSNNNLVLNYTAGTSENVSISEIRKIVFGTTTGTDKLQPLENSLQVYPNPASDLVYLKNIPDTAVDVTIYTLSGIQVAAYRLSSIRDNIYVGNLSEGMYLLKANGQISKFTKR